MSHFCGDHHKHSRSCCKFCAPRLHRRPRPWEPQMDFRVLVLGVKTQPEQLGLSVVKVISETQCDSHFQMSNRDSAVNYTPLEGQTSTGIEFCRFASFGKLITEIKFPDDLCHSWLVRYTFIQIEMKLSLFIPKMFTQNHFHPKTTFIQNHFHPKSTFIPNHFHPKPLSSKTIFIPYPKPQPQPTHLNT